VSLINHSIKRYRQTLKISIIIIIIIILFASYRKKTAPLLANNVNQKLRLTDVERTDYQIINDVNSIYTVEKRDNCKHEI